MAAPAYNPSVEQILALHAEFDPPEGHKAQVIGGNFVVSPSPSGRHGLIYSRLHTQLSQLLPGDLVVKVRGYAASGVPIYLLVDPLEQAVTLFFEPSGDCYQQMHRVPFGATISLPEPYVGKIDTSVFA
jgi:Uma2 family endonuclease